MSFEEWEAEQLKDLRFRFWYYLYWPYYWLFSLWYRLKLGKSSIPPMTEEFILEYPDEHPDLTWDGDPASGYPDYSAWYSVMVDEGDSWEDF